MNAGVDVGLDANPTGDFTWTRNDLPITADNVWLTASNITFNPVRRENEGSYTIFGNNTAGSNSTTFQVTVNCKLRLTRIIYRLLHSRLSPCYFRDIWDAPVITSDEEGKAHGGYRCIPKVSKQLRDLLECNSWLRLWVSFSTYFDKVCIGFRDLIKFRRSKHIIFFSLSMFIAQGHRDRGESNSRVAKNTDFLKIEII